MVIKTAFAAYVAHFSYGVQYPVRRDPLGGSKDRMPDLSEPHRETICRLHFTPCDSRPCNTVPEGLGIAVCSPKDEFIKATGRKIALAKAMKDLGLGRNARTELWVDYLRQVAH